MTRLAGWRAFAVLLCVAAPAACGSEVSTTGGAPPTSVSRSTVPATTVPTTVLPTTVPPTTVLPTTVPPTTVLPTTVPPTTAPPTTAPPTTVPPTTVPRTLERGDEGPLVSQLQERLRALHFWIGPVDGAFENLTEQAVFAFQKANGLAVDGRVGPATRAALADPILPSPRSSQGRVTEIDKARQLLYTVVDGKLEWVLHTSTGTEQPYQHPAGYTALADTPPGTHSVFAQTDAWEDGRLGPMYRPKYFHHDGIAVHGYGAVPPYTASHGCVRVTFSAMDHIWESGLIPMGSTVLVYGESPSPGPAA
jgi:peptidoglycan hydrolase-like protein with peptidoglycan-binding domain